MSIIEAFKFDSPYLLATSVSIIGLLVLELQIIITWLWLFGKDDGDDE